MAIPQTIFRPYRVVEHAPLAQGMFRLVLEAVDAANPLPPFVAGQWVNLRLLNDDGSEWAKAAYSLANTPASGTQRIELGIKIEGDFTKRLAALPLGGVVELQGPWGVFTMKSDYAHHVLIAGGIGVTPFVSMIRERVARGEQITLLYSCRTPEEAAYLEELTQLAAAHPHFTLVSTCTRASSADWSGSCGRIDAEVLRRVITDTEGTECLLCGPDVFMNDIRAALLAQGFEPKAVRQESFG